MLGQRMQGFSLAELLLSLALSSIIMLAASKTLPLLRQHSLIAMQRVQLVQTLDQLAFTLEKELRRAGFCLSGTCERRPLFIGQAEGEAAGSCVIVAYDFPADNSWQSSKNEAFAYRLSQGRIESLRGKVNCQSRGWEGLTDEKTLVITQFHLRRSEDQQGHWLTLQLAGQMRQQPTVQWQLSRQLRLGNQ